MAYLNVFSCLIWILVQVTTVLSVSFSPNVTIVSCTSRTLVVDIVDAADGGIVYIQGRSTDCKRFTSSLKTTHAFDFDTCSLKYDSKFRLVIQRHPRYQTGFDKVIPIMCLVDTSDIFVSSVMFPEEIIDGTSVNKTVKPIINMNILTENETSPVTEVTLNDKVKLKLQLDEEYLKQCKMETMILPIWSQGPELNRKDVFDIKATDCSAAFIPILENECSTDEELFPNFVRTTQGEIISTFNAFKPTNLPGDVDLDVGFTCTVSVCKGSCDQTICGEIIGWGRRRRDSEPRDAVVENVTVGCSLKVKAPKLPEAVASLKSEYCAEKTVVTAVSGFVIVLLVFSWMICGCALCKLQSKGDRVPGESKIPNPIRRLSEINVNFAKSVGRRLSTMLNIPTGYDINEQRLKGGVHDCDTPPSRRRDSVTVRNSDMSYLRKRYVSSSTQTHVILSSSESGESSYGDDEVFSLTSVPSLRRSSNPITSISISSSSSKSKIRKSALELPRQNSEIILSEKIRPNAFRNRSATIGSNIDNESGIASLSEPIIDYDTDDSPKARKHYVGVIHVKNEVGGSFKSVNDTKSDVGENKPRSVVVYNDQTRDTDISDDVFDALFEQNNDTHTGKNGTRADNNDGVCSNAGLGDINKKRLLFDTDELKSRVELRHEKAGVYNVGIGVVGDDVIDKTEPADDVYEVIEIGAQIKRERKYSTHV